MKVTALSYGQFLLNSYTNFTGTYFADTVDTLEHDSVYRYLKSDRLTPSLVFEKARQVAKFTDQGVVCFDDTVLNKNASRKIDPARSQYSGNAHHVVTGIGVVNCVYVDPATDDFWILDYRIYDPDRDGKTKLQHVADMLRSLEKRQVAYATVLMDSWYATVPLMRQIDGLGKHFYCPLKSNRQVDDSGGTVPYQSVSQLTWTDGDLMHGKLVKVKGFPGSFKLKLFRVVVSTDRTDYVVSNDLTQDTTEGAQEASRRRWKIEQFHREEKQLTGIERSQVRLNRSQRNHICLAILAWHVLKAAATLAGKTIYAQKRDPLQAFVASQWRHPTAVFAM